MRSLLSGPLVRIVPIGLVFLGIQRKVCAQYRPFDVVVDIVLCLVVGAGAGGGPERGALAGFVLGMMFDLAAGTPLGSSALAFGLGGLVAGYVTMITPDPQWWLAGLFAALGAVVGEAAIPVIRLLIGQDGWITPRLGSGPARAGGGGLRAQSTAHPPRAVDDGCQAEEVEGHTGMREPRGC